MNLHVYIYIYYIYKKHIYTHVYLNTPTTTKYSDPGIVYRRAVDEELGQGHDHHQQQHQAQPPQGEGPQTHDTPSSLSLSPTFATAASDVPAATATTTLPLAAAAEGNGNGHNNNHSSHSFTSPPAGASPLVVHPSSRSGAPVDPQARIPCSRCEMSRPVGASHCYDCEVCVKGVRDVAWH